MGIINRKHNEDHNIKTGRFGFLECYNDPEISHALLQAIENWVVHLGMNKIIGPYGFSDKDPQGLQVEGFEYPPVIDAPVNEPYVVDLVEKEGYSKEVDCLMLHYQLAKGLTEVHQRIYERLSANDEYKVLEFTKKRNLRPYIVPVLRLVNESYSDIYGFIPMDEQEMQDLAKRYMPILDPRFVKIIINKGQVVAFIVGLPNMTKGIQRSKGKLFPFGLLYLIYDAKTTKKLDLMLAGVRPDHQNKGLEVLLTVRLIKSSIAAGYKTFEMHLVLESNFGMIQMLTRGGAEPHKRFRVFQKQLS